MKRVPCPAARRSLFARVAGVRDGRVGAFDRGARLAAATRLGRGRRRACGCAESRAPNTSPNPEPRTAAIINPHWIDRWRRGQLRCPAFSANAPHFGGARGEDGGDRAARRRPTRPKSRRGSGLRLARRGNHRFHRARLLPRGVRVKVASQLRLLLHDGLLRARGVRRRQPRHHPPSRRDGARIPRRRRRVRVAQGGDRSTAEMERREVVEAGAPRGAPPALRHRRDVPRAVRQPG